MKLSAEDFLFYFKKDQACPVLFRNLLKTVFIN